jgi:hypothetical protein
MFAKLFSRNSTRRRPGAWAACCLAESLEVRSLLSAVVVQLAASQDNTIYNVPTGDLSNGQGQFIVTGGSGGIAAARRGLIAFDVAGAGIPEGSTILDVVLTMNLTQTAGGATNVGIHRSLKSWGEGFTDASGTELEGSPTNGFDATWMFPQFGGQAWSKLGGDFASASATVATSALGAYEWSGGDLVADVQDWLDSPNSNFGWFVRSGETPGNVKSFASRNSANAALRPKLEITYEEPVIPAIVEGRKWHDKNANGIRESESTLGLNLQFPGGDSRYNSFGGREYWYQSAVNNSWYFLSPNGNLVRWNGRAKSLTGTVVDQLDPQVWHTPETLLGSAEKSPEPWMNGFVFELVNSSGRVVATASSRDIDRNSDGTIQVESERGWYRFDNVTPGNYTVREVVPEGWVQSASRTSSGALEAFQLDQRLGLTLSGSDRQDFGGQDERWMKGTNGWFYITPAGDFYRWNGRAVTDRMPLSGTLLASPGIPYYRDISLLHAARNPVLGVSEGAVVTRVNFGNYKPLVVTGQATLNQIPSWIRNSSTFTAVVSAEGSSGAGNGAKVYAWTLLIVDPNAVTEELIHYNSTGAKGSKPTGVKSSGGGSRSGSGGSAASSSLAATPTFDLSSIDQGKYMIMDLIFSEA